MKNKNYGSVKRFLKRNKKYIEIFETLPIETLARIATGEIDAVVLATIVMGRRMVLRYTKSGDAKTKM